MAEKVSCNRGYCSDTIAISRDMGPLWVPALWVFSDCEGFGYVPAQRLSSAVFGGLQYSPNAKYNLENPHHNTNTLRHSSMLHYAKLSLLPRNTSLRVLEHDALCQKIGCDRHENNSSSFCRG